MKSPTINQSDPILLKFYINIFIAVHVIHSQIFNMISLEIIQLLPYLLNFNNFVLESIISKYQVDVNSRASLKPLIKLITQFFT